MPFDPSTATLAESAFDPETAKPFEEPVAVAPRRGLVRAPLPALPPESQQMLQGAPGAAPLINIPPVLTTPPWALVARALNAPRIAEPGEEIGRTAAGMLSSMTSPQGIAATAGTIALPEVTVPILGVSMIPATQEGLTEAWQGVKNRDVNAVARGLTKAGLAGGGAIASALHMAKPFRAPRETPALQKTAAELEPARAPAQFDPSTAKPIEPAAPAAPVTEPAGPTTKGEPSATETRKVETSVQPERERTDAQRISAEAGSGDRLQPTAPVEVGGNAPTAPAAKAELGDVARALLSPAERTEIAGEMREALAEPTIAESKPDFEYRTIGGLKVPVRRTGGGVPSLDAALRAPIKISDNASPQDRFNAEYLNELKRRLNQHESETVTKLNAVDAGAFVMEEAKKVGKRAGDRVETVLMDLYEKLPEEARTEGLRNKLKQQAESVRLTVAGAAPALGADAPAWFSGGAWRLSHSLVAEALSVLDPKLQGRDLDIAATSVLLGKNLKNAGTRGAAAPVTAKALAAPPREPPTPLTPAAAPAFAGMSVRELGPRSIPDTGTRVYQITEGPTTAKVTDLGDRIQLDDIQTRAEERGKGAATRVIGNLKAEADRRGVPITGSLGPEATAEGWRKQGFAVDAEGNIRYEPPKVETPKPLPEPPPTPPDPAGPGPGTPHVSEIPPATGGEDVTGVAQRVREKVAAAGQEALPPRGKGLSPEVSVQRGQERLRAGEDPEAVMRSFEESVKAGNPTISTRDLELARAQLHQLARNARAIEQNPKFGTDSPEWRAAYKARSDWAARLKPMQTEWSKAGGAQMGEVDIDTGSYTGLRIAREQQTGKPFTPQQDADAHAIAKSVEAKDAAETAAKKNFNDYARERESRTDAEKHALEVAQKVVIDADVRQAELVRRKSVADAKRQTEFDRIEREAAERAAKAVTKTEKQAAIRAAKDARKAAVAEAAREKAAADEALKADKRAVAAAQKVVRDAARRAAKFARTSAEARADVPGYAWKRYREYLDQGLDNPDEIRSKVATDMGLSLEDVTRALATDKRAKFLADEAWRKQAAARYARTAAKLWLKKIETPALTRALQRVPTVLFRLKVGFHGTVALGTHAPMLAFQPRFWRIYGENFARMYRMTGSTAYHEAQMAELPRRTNYIVGRDAGLVTDPRQFEEFHINPANGMVQRISPGFIEKWNKLVGMGNRGYDVLKVLRQDMFDQFWDQLPQTAKFPEMAQEIARHVNHATGVTESAPPKHAHMALFAPRLLGSRVAWLGADPARAAGIFARWNKATQAEKWFAVNQVKEKAWTAGTLYGLLALDQGMLKLVGSKQDVNMTDPTRSDFLRFKVAGENVAYGSTMVRMATLPIQLLQHKRGGFPVRAREDFWRKLGEFAGSQLSPAAGLGVNVMTGEDFQGRPLPWSKAKVPKRLYAQGYRRFTWPEFVSETSFPIPAQEAMREVWRYGLGLSEEQIREVTKGLVITAIAAGTGARVTEDTRAGK